MLEHYWNLEEESQEEELQEEEAKEEEAEDEKKGLWRVSEGRFFHVKSNLWI